MQRDDAWVAVGRVGETTITLQARGIAPDRVELVRVSRPGPDDHGLSYTRWFDPLDGVDPID